MLLLLESTSVLQFISVVAVIFDPVIIFVIHKVARIWFIIVPRIQAHGFAQLWFDIGTKTVILGRFLVWLQQNWKKFITDSFK